MAKYYVICIVKHPDHDDPKTRVKAYGVATNPLAIDLDRHLPAEEVWVQEKMIRVLRAKEHIVVAFGTHPETGKRVFAELEVIEENPPYVKSKNDVITPDNLLEQRECDDRDPSEPMPTTSD